MGKLSSFFYCLGPSYFAIQGEAQVLNRVRPGDLVVVNLNVQEWFAEFPDESKWPVFFAG